MAALRADIGGADARGALGRWQANKALAAVVVGLACQLPRNFLQSKGHPSRGLVRRYASARGPCLIKKNDAGAWQFTREI
jgi:hypothetical protein